MYENYIVSLECWCGLRIHRSVLFLPRLLAANAPTNIVKVQKRATTHIPQQVSPHKHAQKAQKTARLLATGYRISSRLCNGISRRMGGTHPSHVRCQQIENRSSAGSRRNYRQVTTKLSRKQDSVYQIQQAERAYLDRIEYMFPARRPSCRCNMAPKVETNPTHWVSRQNDFKDHVWRYQLGRTKTR